MILSASRASGWVLVAPPTRPTGIGISSVPTRAPLASFSQWVSEV